MTKTRPEQPTLRSALSRCRQGAVSVGVLSLVINLLLLTGPLYMLQVYDRVLTSGSVPTLVGLSVLVVGLYGVYWMLDAIRGRILCRVAERVDVQMSSASFITQLALPLVTGTKSKVAEPVRDLDEIRQFLAGSGPVALSDLPWIPIYLGIVFLFHPLLGSIGLAAAILIVALLAFNELMLRRPVAALARHASRRNGRITNATANAGAVAAMGMRPHLSHYWSLDNEAYLASQRMVQDRSGVVVGLIRTVRFLIQSAILGVGAWLAIGDALSPGAMIAASIITARALAPVEQAIGQWRGFVGARQAYMRLSQALAAVPDSSVVTSLPAPCESLEVTKLVVVPAGASTPSMRGANFTLKAGDVLGIIGRSGSGKSSLARALVGIWSPAAGHVRIDGADLSQWEHGRLGSFIGYLPQDIALFDGTVAQNIARFDPDATSEAVVESAKRASAHDMITSLPDGYETEIGAFGTTLSGGQRQRIALARALFGKPFLVVLDEPNSNLDGEGERALAHSIAALRAAGSIVIIIAHRSSAIAIANKLLHLEAGRQADFGDKQDVLGRLTTVGRVTASNLKVVNNG